MEKMELKPLPPTLPESGKGKEFMFLLGADDPEMTAIEGILKQEGKTYSYATYNGERVHPGNAYSADPINVREGVTVVLIECEPIEFVGNGWFMQCIDHHRRGDFGYNLPPSLFWEASSIGQLYTILGLGVPTEEHLYVAAMDHCIVRAMMGECRGIDHEKVKMLYRHSLTARKNISLSEVVECMKDVEKSIAGAPSLLIGDQRVVDTTRTPTGYGYSLKYMCTIGVAAELRIPVLLSNKNKEYTPEKRVLLGAVAPETIISFMNEYAPKERLVNVWGDPNRGYAGGNRS